LIYYLLKSFSLSAISLRTLFSLITTFLIVVVLLPAMIRGFLKEKVGQPKREHTPQTHDAKRGKPTMGGVVMVVAILFSALAWCGLNVAVVWVLFVMLAMAIVGFLDDLKKVATGKSDGVSAYTKLGAQFVVGLLLGIWLFVDGKSYVFIPGINTAVELGKLYPIFAAFVVTATSNAVNLTDGLDGLAAGTILIAILAYVPVIYVAGNKIFSSHIGIPFISYAGELAPLAASVVGACLGFLWYNCPPAEIFMGDVGSLSVGAALGALALVVKQELLLPIVGIIFVVEALSVIIQVTSYRFFGRKVFRMSPIHHHFELLGWAETKIVLRFWIVAIIASLLGLAVLGIGVIFNR